MIVDVENHLHLPDPSHPERFESGKITERYWGSDGRLGIRKSQGASDVDRFLEFMDDAGIDVAALSKHYFTLEEQRRWNDRCAEVIAEHPDRFAAFANVSPLGGEEAFDEMERAIEDLGLHGVRIYTRNEGTHLDSEEMWPFYRKVSELDVPINVHITTSPEGFDALKAPYALYYVVAREFDMAAETLRLCFGGVLEEFPDLEFIMNHFGGGVSSVLDRFDAKARQADQPGGSGFYRDEPLITEPYRTYFDKLYFNMAGRGIGTASVEGALTQISPQRLMFGTDWPLNFDYEPERVRAYVDEIRGLDLSEGDIEDMLGGNAVRLLDLPVP